MAQVTAAQQKLWEVLYAHKAELNTIPIPKGMFHTPFEEANPELFPALCEEVEAEFATTPEATEEDPEPEVVPYKLTDLEKSWAIHQYLLVGAPPVPIEG